MEGKLFVPIARIHTPYTSKFGIPRQSGLVSDVVSEIEFLSKYRNPDAVRGLSDFSHIWVLWQFNGFESENWSPTVRPPRLGGNKRMGVFATRSPNRPNPVGLSSLKLIDIDTSSPKSPILKVSGADMLDNTLIYDIKPYIPFTDAHPDASSGFAAEHLDYRLKVSFDEDICSKLSKDKVENIKRILSFDPRPSYQNDPERIYGLNLYNHEIKFRVVGDELIVLSIVQD